MYQGAWRCESVTTKTPINYLVKKAEPEKQITKVIKKEHLIYKKSTHSVIEKVVPNASPIAVIYFDFDRFVLKPEDKISLLDSIAFIGDKPIELHGYADSIGDKNYNHFLGLQRANKIKDFYLKTGISPSKVAVYGHGFCCYSEPNETKEQRAKSRRVEIYLSSP